MSQSHLWKETDESISLARNTWVNYRCGRCGIVSGWTTRTANPDVMNWPSCDEVIVAKVMEEWPI